MKKYCIILAFFGCIFTSISFANWDSLNISSIEYDTTTCTLSMVRNISSHHSDTYKYIVRGPVIVNIPLQTASGSGSNWSISPTTYMSYTVPACNQTCSLGTSPISTISAFQVTGKNGTAPYTYTLAGFDRNIYVVRKTEIPVCLRCQEGKYWCPSANACLNTGEICGDHQCNNDTVCDINEGCGCGDCNTKQDHCAAGLVCDYVASNPNNSSCIRIGCEEGKYFCAATQTCVIKGTPCDHQCNNNTTCDTNEGCGCPPCDGQQDHCADTLICQHNVANPNHSQCISTECESGQYWCSATRSCVANTMSCNGTCKSPLILHNNQCIPDGSCLPGNLCCPVGTYFCSLRSTCVAAGQICNIY